MPNPCLLYPILLGTGSEVRACCRRSGRQNLVVSPCFTDSKMGWAEIFGQFFILNRIGKVHPGILEFLVDSMVDSLFRVTQQSWSLELKRWKRSSEDIAASVFLSYWTNTVFDTMSLCIYNYIVYYIFYVYHVMYIVYMMYMMYRFYYCILMYSWYVCVFCILMYYFFYYVLCIIIIILYYVLWLSIV